MPESPRPLLSSLYAFVLALVLVVWVGGSTLTDFFVIPAAFTHLPRNEAIDFGAFVFRRWNYTECLLGALGVLAAFAMAPAGWGTARRQSAATVVLCAMTMLSLFFLLYLTPAITNRVQALREAGLDLGNLTWMPPERLALRRMHTTYAILDAGKLALGALALWLFASRRPR